MYFILGTKDLKTFVTKINRPEPVLTDNIAEARTYQTYEQALEAAKALTSQLYPKTYASIQKFNTVYVLYCYEEYSLAKGYLHCCTLKRFLYTDNYAFAKGFRSVEEAEGYLERNKKLAEREGIELEVIKVN